TLSVGNLETKVTEELLFKLFHQDGPVIKVKITKDKDGKPKQFAFVNFKHEVSVPYAMNLLNGIKLFERPIKIQFRTGSSHASQVVSLSYSQHHVGNSSPTSTSPSRYERIVDNMTASAQVIQRSFSSPENYQRQTVMNSVLRQMSYGGKFGSSHSHNHTFNQSSNASQRKVRQNSHPYLSDRHYSRNRDDFFYEDRNHDGWSREYKRRDSSRDRKWRSSRH
ncbi:RBM7-like, partial [Ictidomys tridecemlineatus]|uniref:RRM domain-containing protein n=1 Tax=Ictidomys tridecemlineatus TaxID=43179 RepID=A0A287D1U4_ICTTR